MFWFCYIFRNKGKFPNFYKIDLPFTLLYQLSIVRQKLFHKIILLSLIFFSIHKNVMGGNNCDQYCIYKKTNIYIYVLKSLIYKDFKTYIIFIYKKTNMYVYE